MPELPEAETIARGVARRLAGRRLGAVVAVRRDIIHGRSRSLSAIVRNRSVRSVFRRGKRVIVDLADGWQLVFYMGMTGRLTVVDGDTPVPRHTHLRISVKGSRRELRFCDPRRFGGVWVQSDGTKSSGRSLGELGPEPLELRLPEFRSILNRRRQIKALLLDQGVIAGLGNIYCDEMLFAAQVHPQALAGDLDDQQVRRLLKSMRSVLRASIKAGGTTVSDYRRSDGSIGGFQAHLQVYGKTSHPCPRCKTTIERITAAGRSTHICPRCQSL